MQERHGGSLNVNRLCEDLLAVGWQRRNKLGRNGRHIVRHDGANRGFTTGRLNQVPPPLESMHGADFIKSSVLGYGKANNAFFLRG
jgi:hypothetical protein